MEHEYASCQSALCALCDAYGDGYTAGKGKANWELLNDFSGDAEATRQTLAGKWAFEVATNVVLQHVPLDDRTTERAASLATKIGIEALDDPTIRRCLGAREYGRAIWWIGVVADKAINKSLRQYDTEEYESN